jgi:hypothetical protein
MCLGEAELGLAAAIQRFGGGERIAQVLGVVAVNRGTAVRRQDKEGADAIHASRIGSVRAPRSATVPWPEKVRNAGNAREMNYPGDDLFSQGVAPQVSSALESLTSVFGMGTGGSSPLASPG